MNYYNIKINPKVRSLFEDDPLIPHTPRYFGDASGIGDDYWGEIKLHSIVDDSGKENAYDPFEKRVGYIAHRNYLKVPNNAPLV